MAAAAVAQLRGRWHRSLQLRVVSTTLVLSALVIAVLGFFLVQAIAAGLLSNVEKTATDQVNAGHTSALGNPAPCFSSRRQPADAVDVAELTARSLQLPARDAQGTTWSSCT